MDESICLTKTKTDVIAPFKYTLVKLASRCNIACKYCYWFRDNSVYKKPGILEIDVENAFLNKLEEHIVKYQLDSYFILFHGGEPLLFGKKRFERFCSELRKLEKKLNINLKLAVTTNGILIDDEWCLLFNKFNVHVTISIDGPSSIHDLNRVDFQNKGTAEKVFTSLVILRSYNIEPGIISVCNPDVNPKEICDFFVETLKIKWFDILIPDATHEDHPKSIAKFYKNMFDLWYNIYSNEGIEIRFIRSIIRGLLGYESNSESIGYGPITTFTLLTDGSLEPLDVLRIGGNNITKTNFNILRHNLQDIETDPLWQEVYNASINLSSVCQECEYKFPCGGGHIASRWSKKNRLNNPSVYCDDLKEIMKYSWKRIINDIYIETEDTSLSLVDALKSINYENNKVKIS